MTSQKSSEARRTHVYKTRKNLIPSDKGETGVINVDISEILYNPNNHRKKVPVEITRRAKRKKGLCCSLTFSHLKVNYLLQQTCPCPEHTSQTTDNDALAFLCLVISFRKSQNKRHSQNLDTQETSILMIQNQFQIII